MIFAYPGFKISHNVRLFVALFLLAGVGAPKDVEAHLELYHNVEVNLTETAETGIVRLYFTIHAPELLVGLENAGSDIFDVEWLRTRSDKEFQTLFERGRTFVKEKFGFRIDSDSKLDLSERLRFEKPETIRDENYQSGVPVGCLLVSAELKLDSGSKQMEVSLAKDAGKRLLLVCTRKGAFPETEDMDAGNSVILLLPERKDTELPVPEATDKANTVENEFPLGVLFSFFVVVALAIFWQTRRLVR